MSAFIAAKSMVAIVADEPKSCASELDETDARRFSALILGFQFETKALIKNAALAHGSKHLTNGY